MPVPSAQGPQAHTPRVWGPHARLIHDGDLKLLITWLQRRPSLKDQRMMQMNDEIFNLTLTTLPCHPHGNCTNIS